MGAELVGVVTTLIIVVGLLGSARYLISQVRSQRSFRFSLAGFLVVYVDVAAFAGMLVTAIRGSQAVNAGLSKIISPEFSYGRELIREPFLDESEALGSPNTDGQAEKPQALDDARGLQSRIDRENQRLDIDFRVGLWQGLALAITGAVIYGFHLAARLLLGSVGRMRELRMGYLCVMLAVFGLVSILSIPAAVAETMEHLVHITSLHNPDDYVPAAGPVVANVIVFTPIWLVVLVLLIRQVRRTN